MGLFDIFKKKEALAEVTAVNITPVAEDKRFENCYFQEINLTEKNVKIDFDEEEKLVKGTCYLQTAHGNIQLYEEDNLIFEVGKRGKAYKELEPFIGRNVWYVVLKKRHGDFGMYYRATIKHKISKEEAQKILDERSKA